MKQGLICIGAVVVLGMLGAGILGFYSPAAADADSPVTATEVTDSYGLL